MGKTLLWTEAQLLNMIEDTAIIRGNVFVEDGVDKFYGFEVDGNSRFILGKDCTITHNCNQSGRTVIGPEPTLKLGQLAIPQDMASILTIPVRVADFNLNYLQTFI